MHISQDTCFICEHTSKGPEGNTWLSTDMKETQCLQSTEECSCCVIPGTSKACNFSDVYGRTRDDWGAL